MQSLNNLLSYIPGEVSLGVLIIVFASEATKEILKSLEKILEEKKGKEIVLFDHTKVLLVLLWSLVVASFLAIAKIYSWNMMPLWCLGMYGASSIFYELILKRIKKILED